MAGSRSEGTKPEGPPKLLREASHAAQAERIEAMLERWAAEDCSDEPEWDVEQVSAFRIPGS